MSEQLTRDAEKFICVIYRNYLERQKSGESESSARQFPRLQALHRTLFPNTVFFDLVDCMSEAGQTFDMCIHMDGSFELSDAAIIYMENRFKNGLLEVVDFLTKFI